VIDVGRPRIVVVQHHPRDPLGVLKDALAPAADVVLLRGFAEPAATSEAVNELVRSGAYDGAVVLGGPMGVYERRSYLYLDDTLRLLEDALDRGAPVLGLCLGSQLLAHVLGSPVFPGSERGLAREVGFFPLIPAPGGADDPVISLFAPPDPVLLWHRDMNDLPPGTTLLASSDRYPVEAYRLTPRVYGLQFHPEVPSDLLVAWVDQNRAMLAAEGLDGRGLLARARELDPVIRRRAAGLGRALLGWAEAFRWERLG
jgi:GMP synthase (glutamine-hydrolysing)